MQELNDAFKDTKSPEEIQNILRGVDTDHNGAINYNGKHEAKD